VKYLDNSYVSKLPSCMKYVGATFESAMLW